MYPVPYTPDYDYYASNNLHQLEQFRQRFGLRKELKYFIYCGRLVSLKRVDLLIDAFVRVAPQRPEWNLLVVGDGNLREALIGRIPKHLESRVAWTGFLEGDDLRSAYHATDVLVLPSDRDAWALVVQEAMAAGLVVVASDAVGAARDMVENGVSGRIFPAGDVEVLARAMLDVSHPERLTNYKEQSTAALAAWRKALDPVAEIRRALIDVGVLNAKPVLATAPLQVR
jgi:glycosyltransferase involved in cell wall biosynthesis